MSVLKPKPNLNRFFHAYGSEPVEFRPHTRQWYPVCERPELGWNLRSVVEGRPGREHHFARSQYGAGAGIRDHDPDRNPGDLGLKLPIPEYGYNQRNRGFSRSKNSLCKRKQSAENLGIQFIPNRCHQECFHLHVQWCMAYTVSRKYYRDIKFVSKF